MKVKSKARKGEIIDAITTHETVSGTDETKLTPKQRRRIRKKAHR